MRFTSITLQDFRCYYGRQYAALPDPEEAGRNLVPIGGLNGAGKTSLLEAILFGLLGQDQVFQCVKDLDRRGESLRLRERELNSLINRAAFQEGRRAAGVTLVLADQGHVIEIRREWSF